MSETRVMVVDDSAAMRALFSGILENAKGVNVCGVASSAAEAREKIAQLKPDVLTLDVEMPGMSGMEFLQEIMETRPMPVIMLSSIAQAGSGTAARALELGAVHCFPKPLRTTPEEFDATVARLGDIVIRAARGELGGQGESAPVAEEAAPMEEPAHADYRSDGSLVVMAGGQAALASVETIVTAFPEGCPPTIIIIDADREPAESALAAMRDKAACAVVAARDGAELVPGTVHLAFDRSAHVIAEPGTPPRLRCVERDPVGGIRPCADLLFGSVARGRIAANAGLLPGAGSDGAKGMQILMQAGAQVFVESPCETGPRDRVNAVHALGIAAVDLAGDELAQWLLKVTAKD